MRPSPPAVVFHTLGRAILVSKVLRHAAIAATMLLLASSAMAQLAPLHACAHFKTPILMTLSRPESPAADSAGGAVVGALAVELIAPGTGQVIESRAAKAGDVDLAELFPRLWTTDKPQALYAQATLGAERIGSPVVLVPMVAPRYAPRVDRDGVPQLAPPPAKGKQSPLAGYWTYAEQRVSIITSKGEVVFAMRPDAAPNSVAAFRDLVARGFYDGIKIHRITSLSGRTLPDIIQFGDPTGTGLGGPGFFVDFEPSPLKHAYGTLSFARLPGEPNSAGSQVLICLGKEAVAQLDGKYTVFAQMVSGAETLAVIAKTPVDADGKPRGDPVVIESARLINAPPFGAGPKAEADPMDKPTGR